MPVDVLTETVIDRSPAQVATYAGDPSNAPKWYVNIKSVEWETPPPMRIGSKLAFVAQFLGRRLAYTYEVIDLVPGRRLVMKTAQGPFPMETTYTWEPVGEGQTRPPSWRRRCVAQTGKISPSSRRCWNDRPSGSR
jgi:hypothetical protein